MKKTATPLAVVATTVLLLTACGSGDDEGQPNAEQTADPTSPAATQAPAEQPEDAPVQAPAAAEVVGSVTVDGVTYEITELRNCEPWEDDLFEVDLELQGLGEHNGERVQIDVYVQTIAGMPFDDVSWAGPEGVYGGPDDANVTLSGSGDSVSGSATLVDAMTQTDQVSISFELDVPGELIACR